MSVLILSVLGKYRLQIAVALAVLAAVLWWSHARYAAGVKAQLARDEKAVVAAQAKAKTLSDQLARKAADAGQAAQAAQAQIQTRTRTLIERIPYEVPASANPMLGVGFVRTYDASLGLSVDAAAAGQPADQAAIPAADALRGTVGNNAICLQYKDAYERAVTLYDQARATVNQGPAQ